MLETVLKYKSPAVKGSLSLSNVAEKSNVHNPASITLISYESEVKPVNVIFLS